MNFLERAVGDIGAISARSGGQPNRFSFCFYVIDYKGDARVYLHRTLASKKPANQPPATDCTASGAGRKRVARHIGNLWQSQGAVHPSQTSPVEFPTPSS
jgi:hypothetical protein